MANLATDTTLSHYEANAAAFAEDTLRADMSAQLGRFTAHLPAGGNVLDWGCGAGRDARALAAAGFRVTAADACAALCARARDLTGLPVRRERFLELADIEAFDGIWACASLLHLTPAELPRAFELACRALRPDGVLYASFKYGNAAEMRDGRWFTDLDEDALPALLPEQLRPFGIWTSADVRPGRGDERWLNLLAGKVAPAEARAGAVTFFLPYLAPYGFEKLLGFFRARQLEGVERIDGRSYRRTVRLADARGALHAGWLQVGNDPERQRLRVDVDEALLPVLPCLAARLQRQFDTGRDPEPVHAALASLDGVVPGANVAGTRVPGAFDPFETSVRAVLGQQVSVKAANRLAARIVRAYGTSLETGNGEPAYLFPDAADFLRMDPIEDALGTLGVVRTRSRAIRALASMTASGELDFGPGADIAEQMGRLLSIKGIGPWSANYIAMRALGYADAFLETDAGIGHALPGLTPRERLELAERWRPWRAYANLCLWNSLS